MQRRDKRDESELDRQIDAVLSSPEHIQQAAQGEDPLLRHAARLAHRPHPALSAEARARIHARILRQPARLRQPDYSLLAQRLIAGFVLVILLAFASLPASAASVPGDLLYPVKLGWESAELALARNPVVAVRVLLVQANRRLDEQQTLYARTRIESRLFEQTLEKLSAAVSALQVVQPAAAQALRTDLGSTYQRLQFVLQSAETQALIATSSYQDYAAMAEAVVSRAELPVVAAVTLSQPESSPAPQPTAQPTELQSAAQATSTPAPDVAEMTAEPQPAVAEITAEAQTAAALDLPDLSTPYAGQPAFIYARHVVNVRSGPGTGYLVITTLQPDTAVSVISSDDLNEWLQIEMANGMTGWIAAYLLTLEPSSAEIVNVIPTAQPGMQFGCDQPGNACNAPGQQTSGDTGSERPDGSGAAGSGGNNGQGAGRGNRP